MLLVRRMDLTVTTLFTWISLRGGETDGVYTINVVDDDNFTITDSASGTIVAGNTVSYRRRRSVTLQGDNNVSVAV